MERGLTRCAPPLVGLVVIEPGQHVGPALRWIRQVRTGMLERGKVADGIALVALAALGALVGAGELTSRYTDAPKAAIVTLPGMFYVAVNGLAAIGALAIGAVLAPPDPSSDPFGYSNEELLSLVLISGFGSLAFFRAKLVTVRVGDTDVGVGPSFVLEVIMNAADRAVDRARASPRAAFVVDIMTDISFDEAKNALPSFCFALLQNVDANVPGDCPYPFLHLGSAHKARRRAAAIPGSRRAMRLCRRY